MIEYGGLGGLPNGRPINDGDAFEVAASRCLGNAMKIDDTLCVELWSALANMEWKHDNGDTASYTFRSAGDLIAAVIGRGNYMDWYCSGPYAVVSDRIKDALSREGWRPVNSKTTCS